jgi:hypothetical protein
LGSAAKKLSIAEAYRHSFSLSSRKTSLNIAETLLSCSAAQTRAHWARSSGIETVTFRIIFTNLRHQLEERLRGAVNDLQAMLIASAGNEGTLGAYLKSWSGAQNALFRGLLRLKKAEALPNEPEALLEQTARDYAIPTAAFTELKDLQRRGKISAFTVAEGLLESLKALASAVNTLRD